VVRQRLLVCLTCLAATVMLLQLAGCSSRTDGQLVCVDATTGKEVWKHKSPRCYASLVASGNHVYALGRDGTTLIIFAERTYVGTCPLGEGPDATPALGDGRIYIRGRNYLWCLEAQ
jgi:outer membrane protein assembly factor BamB